MRNHYIPQYYLKGFANRSKRKLVWAYEKGSFKKFAVSTENIGFQVDFYTPEVESYLADKIEAPANKAIAKIRARENITVLDRLALANYMAVFFKRGPSGWMRFKQMAPDAIQKVRHEILQELDFLSSRFSLKKKLLQKRRQEVEQILDRYAVNPPKEVWLDNMPVHKSPRSAEAIFNMTWRFLTYEKKPVFLTCDNPVFFFSWMGLADRRTEITFPLSSNIALWATWRSDLQEGYYPTDMPVVMEFNRRIVSNAMRHVFHAEDAKWATSLVRQEVHRLNRIV